MVESDVASHAPQEPERPDVQAALGEAVAVLTMQMTELQEQVRALHAVVQELREAVDLVLDGVSTLLTEEHHG